MLDQVEREEKKISRRAVKSTPEALRAASVAHLDGRRERLEAYADSLQEAVTAENGGANSARLESRLAQAKKEAHAAGRSRVPKARPAQA